MRKKLYEIISRDNAYGAQTGPVLNFFWCGETNLISVILLLVVPQYFGHLTAINGNVY